MRISRRASLLMFCVGILLLIGACSAGGGTPVTPNTGPDLSNYASSVEGDVYKDGGPVTSGEVFIYDLATLELFYKADIGADGGFLAGINEGQYLMFAFSQAGWQQPQLEADFSNNNRGRRWLNPKRLSNSIRSRRKQRPGRQKAAGDVGCTR